MKTVHFIRSVHVEDHLIHCKQKTLAYSAGGKMKAAEVHDTDGGYVAYAPQAEAFLTCPGPLAAKLAQTERAVVSERTRAVVAECQLGNVKRAGFWARLAYLIFKEMPR